MKKRKQYKPKPVKLNAVFNVIQGVKPLSEDDKLHLFKKALSAINRMQFGGASTSDFTILCDVLNVTVLFDSRNGFKNELELTDARESMQNAKQRYIKSKKLVFYGNELQAVKRAFEIHNKQIDKCTYAELTNAFYIQEAKIKRGDFYHREGDLKVSDMVAA